ncbi:MAG TPA: hypothetical protein VFE54_14385 [Mucilaginibacter sp.]|nr:hypothetical protein [Mucilaginibacter sp.]
MPAIKNKIALEIDDEKLQSHIDKKTIYWKNVERIKFADDLTDRLVFILKDKKKVKISLHHIKGGHTDMFNTIESCYKQPDNALS